MREFVITKMMHFFIPAMDLIIIVGLIRMALMVLASRRLVVVYLGVISPTLRLYVGYNQCQQKL